MSETIKGRKFGIILVILLSVGGLIVFQQTRQIELSRTPDPTGQYVAVVSYRSWQKPLSTFPGNSSGHSGHIRIEARDGKEMGGANLPLLQMADDLMWEESGATLVGAGVWDFQAGTFDPWE
ncbi:hypothetical protein N9Z19_00135 [Akkermansiaceae bacterium]|nr:hypothetical protein [Akkermansiaceae bacterium]